MAYSYTIQELDSEELTCPVLQPTKLFLVLHVRLLSLSHLKAAALPRLSLPGSVLNFVRKYENNRNG